MGRKIITVLVGVPSPTVLAARAILLLLISTALLVAWAQASGPLPDYPLDPGEILAVHCRTVLKVDRPDFQSAVYHCDEDDPDPNPRVITQPGSVVLDAGDVLRVTCSTSLLTDYTDPALWYAFCQPGDPWIRLYLPFAGVTQ